MRELATWVSSTLSSIKYFNFETVYHCNCSWKSQKLLKTLSGCRFSIFEKDFSEASQKDVTRWVSSFIQKQSQKEFSVPSWPPELVSNTFFNRLIRQAKILRWEFSPNILILGVTQTGTELKCLCKVLRLQYRPQNSIHLLSEQWIPVSKWYYQWYLT